MQRTKSELIKELDLLEKDYRRLFVKSKALETEARKHKQDSEHWKSKYYEEVHLSMELRQIASDLNKECFLMRQKLEKLGIKED